MRSKSILCYSQIIAFQNVKALRSGDISKSNAIQFATTALEDHLSNLKKLALMTEIIKAKFNQESISGRLCTNQPSLLKQPVWASGIYPSPPHCLAWSIQKIIANVAAFHSNDIKPLSARIPGREFPRTASSSHHQNDQRAKSHEKARLFLYTEKFVSETS